MLAEERARDGRSLRGSLSASTCQKSGELHQWEASEGRYLPFVVGGSGQHGNIRPDQRRLLFESISPNPASSIRVDENHPISGMSPPRNALPHEGAASQVGDAASRCGLFEISKAREGDMRLYATGGCRFPLRLIGVCGL